MDNALRLLHHLAFRDPESGLGDGHGKVIDFDAVKLADAHLDRIADIHQHDLPIVKQ